MTEKRVRILTVNLKNGDASPDGLEALLARFEPDVVMAQELGANAAGVIERRFSYGMVKPDSSYRGKALVASFPIAVLELDFPFRSIQCARAQLDGDEVELLNVHLANPVDGWRGKFPERRDQVRELLDLISIPGPRIVGGDFNSTPRWPAYRRIVERVDDAVADLAARSGVRPASTWGPRPGWPAMLRIDHVFVSGMVATRVEVTEAPGSDHRALVVDLERL